MSYTIKASQLDSSHIGRTVRVVLGQARSEDVLAGITHNSTESRTTSDFSGTTFDPGMVETTLKFERLGEVDCNPNDQVIIVD